MGHSPETLRTRESSVSGKIYAASAIACMLSLLASLSPPLALIAGPGALQSQGQWTGMPACDHVFWREDSTGQHGSSISSPNGVAMDGSGNLYIADCGIARVVRLSPQGAITVVAGNGKIGHSKDGVRATSVSLSYPFKVAADDAGNVYILETDESRLLKVDTRGSLSTVAGGGNRGFSGDGGPAVEASLAGPIGVAVTPAGVLYIADSQNNRIRKIDAEGIITTVAGDGERGYAGDGGPAINAHLFTPFDVAVDSKGILYIADRYNNRIRKVDARGVITTVAGSGSTGGPSTLVATLAGLNAPQAVAVDDGGNLYIADSGHSRICRVDSHGIITTITKPFSEHPYAEIFPPDDPYPLQVVVDKQHNMYLAMFDAKEPYLKISLDGTVSPIVLSGVN